MVHKLTVAGIGPGHPDYLTPILKDKVREAEVLAGGERALALFPDFAGEKWRITADLGSLITRIQANRHRRILILVSGDPGFYSLLTFLNKHFCHDELEVIPGISSLQMAFARLALPWQDGALLSLHGKDLSILDQYTDFFAPIGILTDPRHTPQLVARYLLDRGMANRRAVVAENLTYPEERLLETDLLELSGMKESFRNCVLVIKAGEREMREANWQLPGIPDEEFIRASVPMTKQETRIITIAKLQVLPQSVVFDIGAGTGSMTVETGLLARYGQVFAVERDEAGIELINKNIAKFGLRNTRVIHGEAPDCLTGLPRPDRVIIGGSGGRLKNILEYCHERLTDRGRIVINAITLDTLLIATEFFRGYPQYHTEVICLNTAKLVSLGQSQMFQGRNPVYIITATRERN